MSCFSCYLTSKVTSCRKCGIAVSALLVFACILKFIPTHICLLSMKILRQGPGFHMEQWHAGLAGAAIGFIFPVLSASISPTGGA